jgi:hypothetical protein
LARSFRYYGKKRGHRRSGSPALGNVGEAAFFAVLLLLGCGGLVQLFSALIVPEWRASHELAALVRAYHWWVWLAFSVPLSFIGIGAAGLIYAVLHWGKSAERRAALIRRRRERDFFGGNGDRQFPTVPRGADMTNSPGTKLKFRLPMANSPGWPLFGLLALCVGWNGFVSVLAVLAIRAHLAGKPIWSLTIFTVAFALSGLAALAVFVRRLLMTTGIGPTCVEISDHPLQPGGHYRVFLSQSGRLTFKGLRVALTCEETAIYRQGTATRTESREVFRQELFRHEGFRIHSAMPFETDIELDVPEGVMHSFATDHNEIGWTLVVEGDVAGWPVYRRAFPAIIRPAAGGPSP